MREIPTGPFKYGPRKVRTAVKLAGSVYGAVRKGIKAVKGMKERAMDSKYGPYAIKNKVRMAAESAGRIASGDFREVGGAARDMAAGVIKKSRSARDRYNRAQKAVDYNNDLAKIERQYGTEAAEYSKNKFARPPYKPVPTIYLGTSKPKTMNDAIQMTKDYIRNPMAYMTKGSGTYTPRIERAAGKSQRLGAKIVGGATFGSGAAYGGYLAQKKAARGGK